MDITSIGLIISATGIMISLFSGVYTLRQNHEWNRRNYTASLFNEWDKTMGEHRKKIEKMKPGLLDLTDARQSEIINDYANEIYKSTPDHPHWELRFHFIQMLNFYETIAFAYIYHIGDREMIDRSFKDALIKQHDMLRAFIKVVSKERGYPCWEPFNELISEWTHKPLPKRSKTG